MMDDPATPSPVRETARVFTSRAAGSGLSGAQDLAPILFMVAAIGMALFSQSLVFLLPVLFVGISFQKQRERRIDRSVRVRMDDRGLTISGLGRFPWRSISAATLARGLWRNQMRAFLSIRITPDIENMVEKSATRPALQRPTPRFWRIENAQTLVVQVSGLEDTPDALREAFEFFWAQPVAIQDL